ncbi:MAG: hypothetical protein Q8N35_16070 [Methylococcaceae bacterium]|nr:hypothetical protein [Methylococcaceae bacterium]MDZ4157310.1 hypothetical protein [Methylococcales bacterium]MDP2392599.1 hypothetical protein [Methylococcaceae bacterium]MDP3021099.1 hypothetical protein [Methylococcaceae bacterium]MDP3388486.1 hypothetical protein [Methylococcaceae bacterium]
MKTKILQTPPANTADTLADFSHRLSPLGGMDNVLALTDTVNMMANKAESILSMLSNAFAEDDEVVRPSDDVIFYSLKSISDELADIKAVVSAFHKETAKQRA